MTVSYDTAIRGPASLLPLTRPTLPGETRYWCSCDPDRQHPFWSAADLIAHVMTARGQAAANDGSAAL